MIAGLGSRLSIARLFIFKNFLISFFVILKTLFGLFFNSLDFWRVPQHIGIGSQTFWIDIPASLINKRVIHLLVLIKRDTVLVQDVQSSRCVLIQTGLRGQVLKVSGLSFLWLEPLDCQVGIAKNKHGVNQRVRKLLLIWRKPSNSKRLDRQVDLCANVPDVKPGTLLQSNHNLVLKVSLSAHDVECSLGKRRVVLNH